MLKIRHIKIGVLFGLFLAILTNVSFADDFTSTSSSPTPTASPLFSTQEPSYSFPPLVDQPFPKQMIPSLSNLAADRAIPYADHCHTQQNQTASTSTCIYGNPKSKTSIVLFGDSHALAWFPAINILAKAKGWKLYSFTMSSCWPADIPAWNSTTAVLMPNCSIWRKATLDRISSIRPKMVLVAGTRGFATTDASGTPIYGTPRITTWIAGMERTLVMLKKATNQVFYLSDIPISTRDIPSCIKSHPESIKACSTPVSRAISTSWLALEEQVSQAEEALWVDPTTWICKTDPCSPIEGKLLIYLDGGHLTATFSASLEKPLWAEISTFKI